MYLHNNNKPVCRLMSERLATRTIKLRMYTRFGIYTRTLAARIRFYTIIITCRTCLKRNVVRIPFIRRRRWRRVMITIDFRTTTI